MKKYKSIYVLTLMVLACVLMSINGYSQFTAGGAPENSAIWNGTATLARPGTGNDILYSGGNTYRVAVWDDTGTNPGLAWWYNSASVAGVNFAQTTGISDPDVCLIEDVTGIYAIVVYYRTTNSRYYWEHYKWNGSNAFVLTASAIFDNASFGTSLNIDGNDKGEFVIVYDNTSPVVRMVAGYINSGVPTLYTLFSAVTSGSLSPDVSINNVGSGDRVYITYKNTANGKLRVNYDTFSNISGASFTGPATLPLDQSPAANCTFYNPRIATPHTSGHIDDWTVVAEEYYVNMSTFFYYIRGFNYNNNFPGSVVSYTYNNASFGLSDDLSPCLNTRPVVAYDNSSPTYLIWVGWTWDNIGNSCVNPPSPPPTDAIYPIALNCDEQANFTGGAYLEVPTALSPNEDLNTLSLAGRFGNSELFLTYNNATASDITLKTAPSTGVALRHFMNPVSGSIIFTPGLIDESSDKIFICKLRDLQGKEILVIHGNRVMINREIDKLKFNLFNGVYLVQLIAEDNSVNINRKLFFGN